MCHCQTSQMFHSGAYPCYLKMADRKYQENMKSTGLPYWIISIFITYTLVLTCYTKVFETMPWFEYKNMVYIENHGTFFYKCSPLRHLYYSITHSWGSLECSCQSDPPIECLGRREETFLLSHSSCYLSPTCYRNNHWLVTVVSLLWITYWKKEDTLKVSGVQKATLIDFHRRIIPI